MDYTIRLTEQQMMVVLNALGERPLKDVLDAFTAIQRQAMEQAPSTAGSDQNKGGVECF